MAKRELIKRKTFSEEVTFEKDDLLNRQQIADMFTELFKNSPDSLVVAINAPWGTGKTQFIQMWKNMLQQSYKSSDKKPYEPIYLNLWEEDFIQDPFLTLNHSLIKKFEEEDFERAEEFKNIVKGLAGDLMISLVNSCGLSVDQTKKEINDFFEKRDPMMKQNKEQFKKLLSDLALKTKEKYDFPLIIFIDEVDRCRPSYAVEFLEVAKHFFDVENVIFVLGIDMEQLKHSVSCLYGENMNSLGYLRRFVDFTYDLPRPEVDRYAEILFDDFKLSGASPDFKRFVGTILLNCGAPLREVNSYFLRLKLIHHSLQQEAVKAFLLAIKLFKEDSYKKILSRTITIEEIISLQKMCDFEPPNEHYAEQVFCFFDALIMMISSSPEEFVKNAKQFVEQTKNQELSFNRLLHSGETQPPISYYLNIESLDSSGTFQLYINEKKNSEQFLKNKIVMVDFLQAVYPGGF